MGTAFKIAGCIFGVVLILFGLLLINEFVLESSQKTAPLIVHYPILGPVLVVIGGLLCYAGHKYGKKKPKTPKAQFLCSRMFLIT